jgi:hypothetical protein
MGKKTGDDQDLIGSYYLSGMPRLEREQLRCYDKAYPTNPDGNSCGSGVTACE